MPRHELIRVAATKPASRIARFMDALRGYTLPPLSASSPELARYFGGGPVTSGVHVSEHTALNFSPVWAADALISDDVASLPLMLYKALPNGGKKRFDTHPLYELLHDSPNPQMSSIVWRRTMQSHLNLWQNAYAEIERDNIGRAVAMWPLLPELVTKFIENGSVRYRYSNPSGGETYYNDSDMIHLIGHSHDGMHGRSLVHHARESIGLGIAAEKFGGSFFGNGATFGGVIAYKGARPPEMSDKTYTDTLQARHQGVERAHKLLALYNDASYTQTGTNPNEAQFLETRVFQIREVARWFKIPPHMLGDLSDATYSNVEQMMRAYYGSCLRPILQLWEQELSRKLISRLERKSQTIEHVTQGLLSADAAGRSALYQAEFNVAAITPNEVRGFEGMDPRPEGDRTYIQLGFIPADRMDEWIDAEIAAKTWHQNTDTNPNDDVDPQIEAGKAETKALREALDLSRHATQLAEDKADLCDAGRVAELAAREAAQNETRKVEETLVARTEALADTEARRLAAVATCVDLEGKLTASESVVTDLTDQVRAEKARVQETLATLQRQTELREHAEAEGVALKANVAALNAEAIAIRAETEQVRDQLTGEIATLTAEREAIRTAGESERIARDAEKSEYERALAHLESLRAEVVTERDTALTDKAAAEDRAMASEAERDALRRDSEADRDAHGKGIEVLHSIKQSAEAERDLALIAQHSAEAQRDEARLQAAANMTAATDSEALAREAHVEAQTATARAEAVEAQRQALAAEVETLKTDVARARADIASELDAKRTQKATLLAAMRSLFVDASERLLQYESDRARANQGTPEKLRSWVERFYPVHEERVRAAFRALVGPWSVIAGGAPGLLLDRLVAEHMAASTGGLRTVLESEDSDVLAGALERTLRRWEDERSDAVADALVREGMGQ